MKQTQSVDISIIIPCRNEEKHIRDTIRRIINQEGAGQRFTFEVFIIDGQSTDDTTAIVREEIKKNSNIKLIINDRKVTPVALNLGIRNASGKYIAFLGAHADIAKDYFINCLNTIDKVDADAVGGPWKAKGQGYVGEAIALAFQSQFAVGGAKSHDLDYEGYVDTVWGIFGKKDMFEKIGLYDEELLRNQDDEFSYRLNKAGGKIWQSPNIRYTYYCRNNLKHLFKQYMQYGYWKIRVIQKHKIPASIRHIIPGTFTGTLGILAFLSLFSKIFFMSFISLVILYAGFNILASSLTCMRLSNVKYLPVMPVILGAFHFGYGVGFLRGIIDFIILKKHGKRMIADVPLTR
jgi:glycosyltransferase involved in cell wall biosynthesis